MTERKVDRPEWENRHTGATFVLESVDEAGLLHGRIVAQGRESPVAMTTWELAEHWRKR